MKEIRRQKLGHSLSVSLCLSGVGQCRSGTFRCAGGRSFSDNPGLSQGVVAGRAVPSLRSPEIHLPNLASVLPLSAIPPQGRPQGRGKRVVQAARTPRHQSPSPRSLPAPAKNNVFDQPKKDNRFLKRYTVNEAWPS